MDPAVPTEPTPHARPGAWRTGALAAAVVALTLLAYWPCLQGGRVWDDEAHLTAPALRSWPGLGRIWTEVGATQQYYPLLHSAFWLEHRIWGDAVLGYHLVNVLLHALSAVLLVGALRRLAVPGAWLAGMLFALHPVGVESVAWISEQKNTLSLALLLGALLAYLRYDEERRADWYGAAFALFLGALLTKTVTATLPAMLLVVIGWRHRRIDWRRDVRPLLPWFAAAVAAGLTTIWVERTLIGARGREFSLGGIERGLLAARALSFYLGKLVWPADLCFVYPRWQIDAGVWWQWGFPLGQGALVALLWTWRRRLPGALVAYLLFALSIFPALGFFNVYPFVFSYVADHFQYAGIAVAAAAFSAAATLLLRRLEPVPGWLRALPAVTLLGLLGGVTWRQAATFADATTLYRATLARNPGAWLAQTNLGLILSAKPETFPEALAHLREAVRLQPDGYESRNNLGFVLVHAPGGESEACAQFEAAIRLNPGRSEAVANLGTLLMRLPGCATAAEANLRRALQLRPDWFEMRVNLGALLSRPPGREAEAEQEFRTALRLRPDSAEAHYDLMLLLARMPGREVEALAHLTAARRLQPDFEPARRVWERLGAGVP